MISQSFPNTLKRPLHNRERNCNGTNYTKQLVPSQDTLSPGWKAEHQTCQEHTNRSSPSGSRFAKLRKATCFTFIVPLGLLGPALRCVPLDLVLLTLIFTDLGENNELQIISLTNQFNTEHFHFIHNKTEGGNALEFYLLYFKLSFSSGSFILLL